MKELMRLKAMNKTPLFFFAFHFLFSFSNSFSTSFARKTIDINRFHGHFHHATSPLSSYRSSTQFFAHDEKGVISLENAVKKCKVFEGVNEADIAHSLERMTEMVLQDREVVINQGDVGDAMFFITSGKFNCIDENNGEVKAVLQAGDYFGELALLFNNPRSLTVSCAAPSGGTVWKFSREDFNGAMQDYPYTVISNLLKI